MLASLKPIISALILPPGGLLVLMVAVLLLASRRPKWRKALWPLLTALWLTTTQGFGIWLQGLLTPAENMPRNWLMKPPPDGVQAIVILGSGVRSLATEWPDQVNLTPHALDRLNYGATLAKHWRLPMAFSGGVSMSDEGGKTRAEALIADRTLRSWGQHLTWLESDSRDTRDNARNSAKLLLPLGIQHIALVTHAWHQPRASREFEDAGFKVTPASFAAIRPSQSQILRWLPSVHGMQANHWLTHEALGRLASATGLLP